jgi:hypothetical protein
MTVISLCKNILFIQIKTKGYQKAGDQKNILQGQLVNRLQYEK